LVISIFFIMLAR